jgi:hypothetical protein
MLRIECGNQHPVVKRGRNCRHSSDLMKTRITQHDPAVHAVLRSRLRKNIMNEMLVRTGESENDSLPAMQMKISFDYHSSIQHNRKCKKFQMRCF